MAGDRVARELLLRLLDGKGARMPLAEAAADVDETFVNAHPPNVPYTPWQLLEHVRFTQRDILDFVRDPAYKEPHWPDDYWPPRDAVADLAVWRATVHDFEADLAALKAMAADPEVDLFATIPHAGVTLFQELLLVADHNAYHVGELAILRQVMDAWPTDRTS
jgi:hypothetical protein